MKKFIMGLLAAVASLFQTACVTLPPSEDLERHISNVERGLSLADTLAGQAHMLGLIKAGQLKTVRGYIAAGRTAVALAREAMSAGNVARAEAMLAEARKRLGVVNAALPAEEAVDVARAAAPS